MISDALIVPGSTTRLLTLDQCRPELKQIFALWDLLRGERSMPSRSDFNPAAARSLLPHLILVDVFPDQSQKRRFRVRLHGTAQVRYQGDDWTGAYIHEKTDTASADRLCAVGDYILAKHEPWISTGNLYWQPNKRYRKFESILLPMSDDGTTVNMILGLTIFF